MKINNNINSKIRIAIYTVSLSNGGLQRITSILINHFEKIKIFEIYLFCQKPKEKDEFTISENIKRILIKNPESINSLIEIIRKKKIDIFIYQFPRANDIKILNNLKNVKVIFYIHSSICYWFYVNYFEVLKIYKEYQNSKYIISLIPVESNYLFKKWGINSILLENFVTHDYNTSIVSDLSSTKILLIGRGASKLKRFELGIQAIEYIRFEFPELILKIISKREGADDLESYINNLDLKNYIQFSNDSYNPSIYFNNASLNYITSISECFPMVLSETKIYGIPNILLGLNYVMLANKGTKIIYDDTPETLAKVSKKILFNKIYKKKLSRKARISMKYFNNENLSSKWQKLLLSIYNNLSNYKSLLYNKIDDNQNELYNILKKQIALLNKRIPKLKHISIEDIENLPKYNFSLKTLVG